MNTQILTLLSILLLFLSCKKSDPDLKEPKSIKSDVVKYLDIVDATLLLNIPNGGGDKTFSKLTLSDDIKPVTFKNEKGDAISSDLSVSKIANFNVQHRILSLTYPSSSDLLLNIVTGEVQDFPHIDIDSRSYDGDYRCGYLGVQKDKFDNIYYHKNGMVYQILYNDWLSISEYIPKGQDFDKFLIDSAGNCLFGNYFSSTGNYKIKLISGAIVPLTEEWFKRQLGFMFQNTYNVWLGDDGFFYIMGNQSNYMDRVVVQLHINNGQVVALQNTKFANIGDFLGRGNGIYIVDNPVNQTVVFPGHTTMGELNTADHSFRSYPHDVRFMDNNLSIKKAKSSIYIINSDLIIRVSLADYTEKTVFDVPSQYQISEVYTSEADDGLFFIGLRYSDGKRILGKIYDDTISVYDNIIEGFEVVGKL